MSDTIFAALVSGAVAIAASTITTLVVGKQNRRLEEQRWREERRTRVSNQALSLVRAGEAWARHLGGLLTLVGAGQDPSDAMKNPDALGAHEELRVAAVSIKLTVSERGVQSAVDDLLAELERQPSIAYPALSEYWDHGRASRGVCDEAHRRVDQLQHRVGEVAQAVGSMTRAPLAS